MIRKNRPYIMIACSGFEKLAETLQWCRHLGIDTVTVYAFRHGGTQLTNHPVTSSLLLT
jgi:undecaprenyl pyrophosphate synthase